MSVPEFQDHGYMLFWFGMLELVQKRIAELLDCLAHVCHKRISLIAILQYLVSVLFRVLHYIFIYKYILPGSRGCP